MQERIVSRGIGLKSSAGRTLTILNTLRKESALVSCNFLVELDEKRRFYDVMQTLLGVGMVEVMDGNTYRLISEKPSVIPWHEKMSDTEKCASVFMESLKSTEFVSRKELVQNLESKGIKYPDKKISVVINVLYAAKVISFFAEKNTGPVTHYGLTKEKSESVEETN